LLSASKKRAGAMGNTTGYAIGYSTRFSFLDLCFWAFLKHYLSILFLILVLRSCSWIVVPGILIPGVLVLGITGIGSLESLRSRARRSRQSSAATRPPATYSWQDIFRDILGRGSMREAKNILLGG
jgi:hypothetical protein